MSFIEATETKSAQHKPRREIEASGAKLKTAQHKPRHKVEASTRSASTQQQQPSRTMLFLGLPGFAHTRITWSWPKASSSMLDLALLCFFLIPVLV